MKSLIPFLLLTVISVNATDYCVKLSSSGGANNGTDWNNAWRDTDQINWAVLNAGDNIFIAGTNQPYKRLVPTKGGSAANRISLIRSRATNNAATIAGWNTLYDTTVIIDTKSNNTVSITGVSGLAIDGQIPGGILITNSTPTNYNSSIYIINPSSGSSSISFKYLKVHGPNFDSQNGPPFASADRRAFHSSGAVITNIYFGYCEFKYCDTLFSTLSISNLTIEHCFFGDNWRYDPIGPHNNVHQTAGVTNCIYRYNEWSNFVAEGIMMDFVGPNDAINQNWDIYGNVIHDHASVGRFLTTQWVTNNNHIRVYNNTFVNFSFVIAVENGGSWGPNNEFYGNIVYNAGSTNEVGFHYGTDDYNASNVGLAGAHSISGASFNMFVNYGSKDYHIITNIGALFPANKGTNLSTIFTKDFDGNSYGADGFWDIGAYEAGGSSFGGGATPSVTRVRIRVL